MMNLQNQIPRTLLILIVALTAIWSSNKAQAAGFYTVTMPCNPMYRDPAHKAACSAPAIQAQFQLIDDLFDKAGQLAEGNQMMELEIAHSNFVSARGGCPTMECVAVNDAKLIAGLQKFVADQSHKAKSMIEPVTPAMRADNKALMALNIPCTQIVWQPIGGDSADAGSVSRITSPDITQSQWNVAPIFNIPMADWTKNVFDAYIVRVEQCYYSPEYTSLNPNKYPPSSSIQSLKATENQNIQSRVNTARDEAERYAEYAGSIDDSQDDLPATQFVMPQPPFDIAADGTPGSQAQPENADGAELQNRRQAMMQAQQIARQAQSARQKRDMIFQAAQDRISADLRLSMADDIIKKAAASLHLDGCTDDFLNKSIDAIGENDLPSSLTLRDLATMYVAAKGSHATPPSCPNVGNFVFHKLGFKIQLAPGADMTYSFSEAGGKLKIASLALEKETVVLHSDEDEIKLATFLAVQRSELHDQVLENDQAAFLLADQQRKNAVLSQRRTDQLAALTGNPIELDNQVTVKCRPEDAATQVSCQLRDALDALLRRHDMCRTSVVSGNPTWGACQ